MSWRATGVLVVWTAIVGCGPGVGSSDQGDGSGSADESGPSQTGSVGTRQRPAGLIGSEFNIESTPIELAPGQSGPLGWWSGYAYSARLHEAREGSCPPGDQTGWFSVAINFQIAL